jgi:hypothetical protein
MDQLGILVTFRYLLCLQVPGTHEMAIVLETKVEKASPNFWDCYQLTNYINN